MEREWLKIEQETLGEKGAVVKSGIKEKRMGSIFFAY